MSNNGGRISNTHGLSQSDLLLALRSKRNSVFDLEATATFLQLNNTYLSDVVESRDALVGELQERVAVFE